MTAKEHNKLLSIFFLVQGGLQFVTGLFLAIIYGGMGAFVLSTSHRDEEQMMGGLFIVLAVIVAILIFAFAGFYVLTGMKLLKERSVGRVLGIIASCLALLGFPLGTALGIYGLWFLLGDAGKSFYSGQYAGSPYPPQPPPPSSWQ